MDDMTPLKNDRL